MEAISHRQPRLLSIAGSDSGGGAGIQADLKTFSAHQCYGMTVVTAITAQNTVGVQGVEAVSCGMVAQQLNSVLDDIGADAIKTGMLASAETIDAIVDVLQRHGGKCPVVVDPVCVSTSGHTLLPASAVSTIKLRLLPLATIVTPNIPEAELLAGYEAGAIKTVADMRECAIKLGGLGCRYILVKGGHSDSAKTVVDLLWDGEKSEEVLYERPRIATRNTHGTGCTLSAAIACQLAKGKSVPEAVKLAGDYVFNSIACSFELGSGHGPLNHLSSTIPRSLSYPNQHFPHPFTSYLIAYDPKAWHDYVFHPFPIGLAAGTLPLPAFLHFIRQDYHFLLNYARTASLSAYKSDTMEEMKASSIIVAAVVHETELHIKSCEKYGISREALLATPESLANIAYNRYVLDTSAKGDLLDLKVVTAPCLIGYGHVGKRLVNATEGVDKTSANPYWSWIEDYGGEGFQGAVKTGIDSMEASVLASPISHARLETLAKIFVQATKLEIEFWDDALRAV